MAVRKIIDIDQNKCNGCGLCVPNCAEGALQIIDGKARLISDLFCDGLGACLGHCPEGAISVTEREAADYDERKVMEDNIIPAGENTIKAHLKHLKEHGAMDFYLIAKGVLKEKGIVLKEEKSESSGCGGGCPGSRNVDLSASVETEKESKTAPSELKSGLGHWPVQIHLLSPHAPFLKNKDLVIIADCVAFAYANTHEEFIKGNAVAIGCPKLDDTRAYVEKLSAILTVAQPKSIKVVRMEVPCCGGMVDIVKQAIIRSGEVLPFEVQVISIDGKKK